MLKPQTLFASLKRDELVQLVRYFDVKTDKRIRVDMAAALGHLAKKQGLAYILNRLPVKTLRDLLTQHNLALPSSKSKASLVDALVVSLQQTAAKKSYPSLSPPSRRKKRSAAHAAQITPPPPAMSDLEVQKLQNITQKAKTISPKYVDPHPVSDHQTLSTLQCTRCATHIHRRKCSAQDCNNFLPSSLGVRICAECLFARNALSVDEFAVRRQAEHQCPDCQHHFK